MEKSLFFIKHGFDSIGRNPFIPVSENPQRVSAIFSAVFSAKNVWIMVK